MFSQVRFYSSSVHFINPLFLGIPWFGFLVSCLGFLASWFLVLAFEVCREPFIFRVVHISFRSLHVCLRGRQMERMFG